MLAHQFAAGTPQEATEVIELWDVGGANVHRQTAARVFSENVSGIIFVHDLSNSRSEENLSAWATLLEESAHGFGGLLGAGGSPQRYGDFNRLPDMEQVRLKTTIHHVFLSDWVPAHARCRLLSGPGSAEGQRQGPEASLPSSLRANLAGLQKRDCAWFYKPLARVAFFRYRLRGEIST